LNLKARKLSRLITFKTFNQLFKFVLVGDKTFASFRYYCEHFAIQAMEPYCLVQSDELLKFEIESFWRRFYVEIYFVILPSEIILNKKFQRQIKEFLSLKISKGEN